MIPRVREQLSEILSKAPFHYSARMLLTQGNAVERPTRVERAVAARILRSAVEPLTSTVDTPLSQLSVKRLLSTGEATKTEIERFAPVISPGDGDLLKSARDLSGLADILGRGKRDGSQMTAEGYLW